MLDIQKLLKALAAEDSGQDLIEYALVAVLIGLGAVASMQNIATAISGVFTAVGTTLTTNT
jgi:pilus assembly protein Flp/PilA